MATKIAFTNFKGGVGKTTSTVNLCKALHDLGKKCLAIDADPQGNASKMLGYRLTSETGDSLYEALSGRAKLRDCIYIENDNEESFDYIPSKTDLYQSEQELVSRTGREQILRMLLDEIEDEYDYIFIDCPPNYGLLSINAMCACDYVLIPVNCEVFALDGLGIISAKCQEIKKLINPKLEILGYIAFRYDGRVNLHKDIISEMEKIFSDKVFSTKIRLNIRAAESPAARQNIFDFAPESTAASDYMELAKEILSKVESLKKIGG